MLNENNTPRSWRPWFKFKTIYYTLAYTLLDIRNQLVGHSTYELAWENYGQRLGPARPPYCRIDSTRR